jgi:ribosomal protein uL23
MNPYQVLKNALMTEKSMDLSDRENKLIFVVDKRVNKNTIREAVEKLYGVKVLSVNTQTTAKGQKKAFVQLAPESSAEEIISKTGVM